jgi:hypothetical protein
MTRQELISQKYISVQKHPTEELYIYNYTQKAQFENFWSEEVQICRGLILDNNDYVVARPFRKFFNFDQHEGELPTGNFKVYDKLDGSLGILYFIGDKPFIATRGSFTSDQAIKANEILNSKYKDYKFDKNFTYLFEIIYPQNRIVVDYGSQEKLVLLAIIETKTGIEKDISDFEWVDKATLFDGLDIDKIKQIQDTKNEGFILKWENGFRLKFKFDEYKRLHRILTSVSAKTIWEFMKDSKDLDEIIDKVPDEFFGWVKDTKLKLHTEFSQIFVEASNLFYKSKNLSDRKSQAEFLRDKKYNSLVFGLLDGKDICPAIWKLIKPKFEKPFKNDEN